MVIGVMTNRREQLLLTHANIREICEGFNKRCEKGDLGKSRPHRSFIIGWTDHSPVLLAEALQLLPADPSFTRAHRWFRCTPLLLRRKGALQQVLEFLKGFLPVLPLAARRLGCYPEDSVLADPRSKHLHQPGSLMLAQARRTANIEKKVGTRGNLVDVLSPGARAPAELERNLALRY